MSEATPRKAVLAAVVAALMAPSAGIAAERQTVGYVEEVLLYPGGVPVRAKIDSGAHTSSLDVGAVVEFDRDGNRWVRFTLAGAGAGGAAVERRVIRVAEVRRAGTDVQKRYVVSIGVCLGRHYKDAEVNLNDRQGMDYKMLIGRRFLADTFFIDASAKNLTRPDCPGAPRP